MRGTDRKPPRCIALEGDIGRSVRCTIYERRASPCRDFQASWVDGQHNERCDRARAAHGLPPLAPPTTENLIVVAPLGGNLPDTINKSPDPVPGIGAATEGNEHPQLAG